MHRRTRRRRRGGVRSWTMGGGNRWKIATVRGIPLYVSTSWFVIAALYIWLRYEDLTRVFVEPAEAATIAVLAAVLFFGSVLLHEAAHAIMARSLDLPVSGITLVFWGGATETKASGKGPLGEFLVAFVGPATTLVLAGVFWFGETVSNGLVAATMGSLAGLSLIFAGFNALPGFPLDGGRMLLATVWGITGNRRTAMRAAGYGGIAVGAVIGGIAVWMVATGDIGMAVFLGYVAMILISAGRAMDQRIAIRDQLVQGTVADAMRPRRRPSRSTSRSCKRSTNTCGGPTARRSPSSRRGRSSAPSRSRARARSGAAIRCGRYATACGPWPRPRWSPRRDARRRRGVARRPRGSRAA